MSRVKTFDATGVAPGGKLYAGDLNSIQDQYADLVNYSQSHGVGGLAIGEAGLQLLKFATGEARLTGKFRTDGIIRGLGGLSTGVYTTTQRDAIAVGIRPQGMIIFNSTTGQLEYNAGSDASPSWKPIAFNTANKLADSTGAMGGIAPTGSIMPFAGSVNPNGWLFCDGSSQLRSVLPDLFNALGGASSPWGLPDGTHFNLPQLFGRIPVGLDLSQTEFDALAKTGGEKNHLLSTGEIPSHTHGDGSLSTDVAPDHTHGPGSYTAHANVAGNTSASGSADRVFSLADAGGDAGDITGNSSPGGSHNHDVSGATSASGGGGSHNNLQPYRVVNYIVKT